MKNLKIKFQLALLCSAFLLISNVTVSQTKQQENKEIQPLKLGEQVPDLNLGDIYAGGIKGLKNAKVSDFRGKLLMLDFWATTCGFCIQQFPKLSKLQEEFGDGLQILPVGFSKKVNGGSVKEAIDKWKGTYQEMKVPTVIAEDDNNELSKLFPYVTMPTIVWISKDGKLLGVTDYHALTKQNIADLLLEKKLNFRGEKDEVKGRFYSPEKPFLISNTNQGQGKGYRSILIGNIDSLYSSPGLQKVTDEKGKERVFALNTTIFEMFGGALAKISREYLFLMGFSGQKRMVVDKSLVSRGYQARYEVEHADNWIYDEFIKNSQFNYEFIPDKKVENDAVLFKIVLGDLKSKFKVRAGIEKRKMPVYALVKSSNYNALEIPTQNIDYRITNKVGETEYESTTESTIGQLNGAINSYSKKFIIDETGLKRIRIKYPYSARTPSDFKTALNKCGLDLIEVEREMEVLVIKDAK
ncbi:thiol-disulfide isomerase/thioredoxin [Pedobacter sp. AK017]|uniref:redoxin domain-containing protein n=1 Tax=Pedobacter sp. AK017 TaxID=2723073 RepID=UPI0016083674|nr:redoxin domain-containing protein [Pedobacter sp. AK017]MBB5436352.1 thiol-disulfide isomerase/thioredoxin [Pedobacter sp. AK017]